MEETIKIPQEFDTFYLKDVSFVNLMPPRIFNVLIVANPYDAFMLEDDGRRGLSSPRLQRPLDKRAHALHRDAQRADR